MSAALWSQQSTAVAGSGNSGQIGAFNVASIRFDANVTALTGGASPSVTFAVDILGADGIWYQVWQGTAITTPGTQSQSIGPGLQTNQLVPDSIRVRWTFAGAPTSITFSASVEPI